MLKGSKIVQYSPGNKSKIKKHFQKQRSQSVKTGFIIVLNLKEYDIVFIKKRHAFNGITKYVHITGLMLLFCSKYKCRTELKVRNRMKYSEEQGILEIDCQSLNVSYVNQ